MTFERGYRRALRQATVRRWSKLLFATTLGTAIITSSTIQYCGWKHLDTNDEALRSIVDAASESEFRPVQGRLSGGFAYRPFRARANRLRRSADHDPATHVRKVSLRIERAMRSDATVELDHAAAVAWLLIGRTQFATEELIRIVQTETGEDELAEAIRRSTNGPLLNDLAVALAERGETADKRQSLEAAARARTLWPEPESYWNYAIAVAGVGLYEPAVAAWNEYAGRDPAPAWRNESQTRIQELQKHSSGMRWSSMVPAARAALRTADRSRIRALSIAFPQQVREWLEEAALPTWGAAIVRSEATAAASILAALRVFAEELDDTASDRLLLDHIAALEGAGQADRFDAAAAHLAFGRAREHYNASEITSAEVEAVRALDRLRRRKWPFASAVMLTLASCHYITGRHDEATKLAQSVLHDRATKDYPAAAARASWILGLISMETGDPRDAISYYTRAAESFRRTGEADNHAATTTLLAQAQDSIGLTVESWIGRYAAFGTHSRLQTVRWRHGVLIEGAMAAVRSRDFALARILLDHLIAVDTAAGDQLGLAAAFRVRSMLHFLLGDERAASTDLVAARRAATTVRDAATQLAITARIETTAALQTLRRNPAEALRILRQLPPPKGTIADVAETSLGISAAHARNDSSASEQLIRTIAALENRLGSTDDLTTQRSPLISQPLIALYDETIRRLVENGRSADALLVSERARASVRRLNRYPKNATEEWKLPHGAAAVVFYAAGQDLISWSVTERTIRTHVLRGKMANIRALVDEFTVGLGSGRSAAAGDRLRAMLLDPHSDALRNAERLLILPDEVLWNLPFAALRAKDGRYLAEHFIIEFTGSAGNYRNCGVSGGTARSAVLIGASRPSGPGLAALPQVRHEIASVRRTLAATAVAVQEPETATKIGFAARTAHILHFAGHAVPNAHEPGLAYLALNGGQRIYARDIRRWQLRRGPVVVLSACNGAARGGRHLESWSSLADAFAHAGAAGIVAATGAVDDASARAFASDFYSALNSSTAAAEAVNTAQRRAISANAAPRAWALYAYIHGGCSD